MKRILGLFGILSFTLSLGAQASLSKKDVTQLALEHLKASAQTYLSLPEKYLIDWKIGDEMNYNVSTLFGGGTLKKIVTSYEGDGLWMRQNVSLAGQNQVIDVLINRNDGTIMRIIQNGQEQEVPNDPLEIISQDYADITVPAGKFRSIHVIAKSQKIKKLEAWINPQDTVMDGTLKQIVQSGFITMTNELVSFSRGQ